MRTSALALLVASGMASAACSGLPSDPEARPIDGIASVLPCNITTTRMLANPRVVPHNTTGHLAAWFIKNTGTTAVTLTGQVGKKTGRVTAVHTTTWTSFPRTLVPGEMIDADVFFDVGAAGTGVVQLLVANSCTAINLTYNVTVQ